MHLTDVPGPWRDSKGRGDSTTECATVAADRRRLVRENPNGEEATPRRAAPRDARGRRPATRVGPAPPGAGPHAGGLEERVDFRRLHGYRLGRVRQALAGS